MGFNGGSYDFLMAPFEEFNGILVPGIFTSFSSPYSSTTTSALISSSSSWIVNGSS